MKKVCVLVCVFCISMLYAHALNVYVAPLTVFSEPQGKRLRLPETPEYKISTYLKKYWLDGLVNFALLPDTDIDSVQSIMDAQKVCTLARCDYLLYGYIKKSDTYWSTEIKLFNSYTKKHERIFFASDDAEHYTRFCETTARNIAEWFAAELRIVPQYKMPEKRRFALDLPFNAGYWTYADSAWANVILGTCNINIGTEFSPGITLPIFFGKRFDVSFGLLLGYRLGVGNPDAYKSYLHDLSITVPAYLNCFLTEHHKLSLGLGLLYESDFLVLYKKYEESSLHIVNQFGTLMSLEYRYKLNDKFSLTSGFDFDIYFSKQTKPAFKTRFGAVYTILERRDVI